MPRHSSVNVAELIDGIRRGGTPNKMAILFGISRMRVSQILSDNAPELLSHKRKPDQTPEMVEKHQREREQLLRVLACFQYRKDAAAHLGLTTSGLYSRMRKLGIPSTSRGQSDD